MGKLKSLLNVALLLTRWVHFASVFILFGSTLFWFYAGAGYVRARRTTERLLRIAAAVAAGSGLGWIAGIIANMAGDGFEQAFDPETLSLFFFHTQFGPIVAIRLALIGAAAIVGLSPWTGRAWLATLMLIGAALLIDQAWLGHAAEGGAGAWGAFMIGVYCIHVIAGAAWVGGLPPLLFALRETRGKADDGAGTVDMLFRFSAVAVPAVLLIAASGLANVSFRVGPSWNRLFMTDYGSLLCAKAALVAVMLGLACANRFVALPRLRSGLASKAQSRRLRASVACELALGLCVLGAAAALGVTPPPQ
jgi:putative copper resistance protein D